MINKYLLLLLTVFIACKKSGETSLKEEYSFTPGITDVEIFVLENNKYEDLNDRMIENSMDNVNFWHFQKEDSIIYNQLFHKLKFENESGGIISSQHLQIEYPFTYTVLDDLLGIDIASLDMLIDFDILDNGDKIESCRYIIAWSPFPRGSNSSYDFFYQINCDDLNYKEAANQLREQLNINSDTVAVFELYYKEI